MNKKLLIAFTGVILIVTFMAGCSQGNPVPSPNAATNPPTTQTSASITPTAQSSVTPDTPDTTSGVLQSAISLKITEPTDAAEISSNTVAVKGETVPGATVTVNDAVSTADDNGNFSVTISLEQGPNAIDIIATDDNGQQGEILILVNAIY
jgi:hypothetical protein